MEKKDHQLYRRPYMMGKARGKEEEAEKNVDGRVTAPWARLSDLSGVIHDKAIM